MRNLKILQKTRLGRLAKKSAAFIAVFTMIAMQSPFVYAQQADPDSNASGGLSPNQSTAFNNGILYFNTEACSTSTNAGPSSSSKTIVLDPGHSGEDKTVEDPETGLHDHDYPHPPEMQDVFDISLKMKSELEDKGYTVILTKGGANPDDSDVNDYVSLRQRAEVANNANAALAVSIHTDPGRQWDSFAQIYVQKTDGYRVGAKGKKTFAELAGNNADAIATASQTAGKFFEDERSKAEGRPAKIVTNSFDGRDGIDPGNLAMVQMFSKVPWVYNEVGAAPVSQHLSKDRQEKYAQGMINAIEKAVPITGGSDNSAEGNAVNDNSNTTSGGNVAMERVDLTQFKPDPKAKKYFDSTTLPKLQKFMPLYVKAAKLEGVPQNWEILAGIHGAESGYSNSFKANFLGYYSGPFQEDTRQLAQYLDDKEYGPDLKNLVTPSGGTIPQDKLTDDQFVVLARLALHRWVKNGLGSLYDSVLKKGPVPFNPVVNSDNLFWKLMATYNGPAAAHYEGFNGYNTTDSPMGLPTERGGTYTIPGVGTTYYLLKQWEANGGMVTAAGSSGCGASLSSSGSPDCQTATGLAKILCEAKKYDPNSYVYGGGHGDGKASNYVKRCPDPTPDEKCGIDCSSLVSIAVYKAFGEDNMWTTGTQRADGKNWKEIPLSEIQAGDTIQPNPEHVEIVDNVKGNTIITFGAHTSHYPQPKQVGPSSYGKTSSMNAYRYIGKGVN